MALNNFVCKGKKLKFYTQKQKSGIFQNGHYHIYNLSSNIIIFAFQN